MGVSPVPCLAKCWHRAILCLDGVPAQDRASRNEVDLLLSEMVLRFAHVEEYRWSTVFWFCCRLSDAATVVSTTSSKGGPASPDTWCSIISAKRSTLFSDNQTASAQQTCSHESFGTFWVTGTCLLDRHGHVYHSVKTLTLRDFHHLVYCLDGRRLAWRHSCLV